MSQTIALFGATGTAGTATALALQAAGHHVTAIARRDPGLPGIPHRDIAQMRRALKAVKPDTVISCLASRSGVPQDAWAIDHARNCAVLRAAQEAGCARFILLSAICVQKPRLAFQHAKLAFEAELMQSGLIWSIVRPTAFFKSLSGQFERLRRGKAFVMFGDGRLTACTPISDGDLGRFIASCLTDLARQNAVLPIGAPGPALTPCDMGAAMFTALDLPPRYRQISPRLIRSIARGLALGGKLSPRLRAKAELARIGQYCATESMLVWDATQQRYDAEATPSFGTETLPDFYRALASGQAETHLGANAVF